MERDDDDDDNDENNRIDSITIRHSVVMMHECMAKDYSELCHHWRKALELALTGRRGN